jgi:DNA-binding LacI/PurR family transcriptional regulator
VSRTFSGGSVSTRVRNRVQAAARQLGYRPNALAAAVITRRSNVIGVLMTANINSHFPEVLSALSHAATARGLR